MNISPAAAAISTTATSSTRPMLPRTVAVPVDRAAPSVAHVLGCHAWLWVRACRQTSVLLTQCPSSGHVRKGNGDATALQEPLSRHARVEPHDVADHLGHRLVVLGRDFLVDLDGGVQRARERRVFDDRNAVCSRATSRIFEGDQVDALGDADRGIHAAFVLQRDGEVGRVGDDDGRLRHRRHHALLRCATGATAGSSP